MKQNEKKESKGKNRQTNVYLQVRSGAATLFRWSEVGVEAGSETEVRVGDQSSPVHTKSDTKTTHYIILQLPPSRSFFTLSATRAASVKASLTPRLRIAEHSRYRIALIRRATSRPWS